MCSANITQQCSRYEIKIKAYNSVPTKLPKVCTPTPSDIVAAKAIKRYTLHAFAIQNI